MSSIFKYFQDIIKNHRSTAVVVVLLCYLFYLLKFPDSYTFGIIAASVTTAAVYIITGNFFFALFSIYSLSIPFKVPAKQYHFLYASAAEYQYEPLPDGIFDSIYFTISTAWGVLLGLFFINRLFHVVILKTRHLVGFGSLLVNPLVFSPLLAWVVYFFLSTLGSTIFSFNPSFSINYLMHEGNIIIIFIGMLYLFLVEKKGAYYFTLILLTNITFHGLLGILQILRLFSEQSYIQGRPVADIEQSLLVRRVGGLIGPNPQAYLMTISLLMLLPFARRYVRTVVQIFVFYIAFVNIIFSQSRTVWLGIFVAILLYYVFNRKWLLGLFSIIRRKFNPSYTILFVILLLIVAIPRISISSLFFSEEGGGQLRKQMISEGLQLLYRSPWLGFGAGSTVRVLFDNFQNTYAREFPFPVHLTFLQIAIESGIPATVAFFIPYYLFVRQVFILKGKAKWRNDMLQVALWSIIITLVFFSFQGIVGRIEFGHSGLILGFGAVALILTGRGKYETS